MNARTHHMSASALLPMLDREEHALTRALISAAHGLDVGDVVEVGRALLDVQARADVARLSDDLEQLADARDLLVLGVRTRIPEPQVMPPRPKT